MTSERIESLEQGGPEPRQLWYLDTSVAVRILLGDPDAVAWWNAKVGLRGGFVSSRLLHLEMSRVYRRENLDLQDVDEFVAQLTLTGVNNSLLTEAAAIKQHVKTLDALHLASARRIGAITLVTHDSTMIKVAEQLGLDVTDPIGRESSDL